MQEGIPPRWNQDPFYKPTSYGRIYIPPTTVEKVNRDGLQLEWRSDGDVDIFTVNGEPVAYMTSSEPIWRFERKEYNVHWAPGFEPSIWRDFQSWTDADAWCRQQATSWIRKKGARV